MKTLIRTNVEFISTLSSVINSFIKNKKSSNRTTNFPVDQFLTPIPL
jgi:hypothetical protein